MHFDPARDTYTNQELRISKHSSTGFIAKKKSHHKNSVVHYLCKLWRHITRPCTRMTKVWRRMLASGIKTVSSPSGSAQLKQLCNLHRNLTSFKANVIDVHNRRRWSLLVKLHLAGDALSRAALTSYIVWRGTI
jgi:hypothetical protein